MLCFKKYKGGSPVNHITLNHPIALISGEANGWFRSGRLNLLLATGVTSWLLKNVVAKLRLSARRLLKSKLTLEANPVNASPELA